MSPYRIPPPEVASVDEDRREDRLLGGIMVTLGSWRVALALALGESCGGEVTIAAIIAGLGARLVITSLARR